MPCRKLACKILLYSFISFFFFFNNCILLCAICCDWVFLFVFVFFNFIYLFYLWLCWVFVSVRGLSLVVASRGHSSSRCVGLSPSQPLLLRSTGSRRAGSVIVAHRPSCSAACGIFPDQGSNPCPLHWQEDSQPLRHQGSPYSFISDSFLIHPFLIQQIFTVLAVRKLPALWDRQTLNRSMIT